MGQGDFTKQEAEATEEALKELFDAIPKSKKGEYLGHLNDISLRDFFVALTVKGVKCMLSNSDTKIVRELYKAFDITSVSAKRAVNSDAKKRGVVGEVVVRNYES